MSIFLFDLIYKPNLYCRVGYTKEIISSLTLHTSLLGILMIYPLLESELNSWTR